MQQQNAPQKPARKDSDIEELQTMLKTITASIVDKPEEIVVFPGSGDGFVHFEIRCDPGDVGTLIGRRGVHADAIRTLMMAAGAVRNVRVTLQILGREGDQYTPGR